MSSPPPDEPSSEQDDPESSGPDDSSGSGDSCGPDDSSDLEDSYQSDAGDPSDPVEPSYRLPPPSEPSNEVEPCYLLKLPGEMKNIIYRLCLVSTNVVPVTSTGYNINSGLLGTCKEIRAEAHAIFYAENTFHHHTRFFDVMPTQHWRQHVSKLMPQLRSTKCQFMISYKPCWANLVIWLETFHADKTMIYYAYHRENLRAQASTRVDKYLIAGMFDTVFRLRMTPWWFVKPLVETNRYPLILLDPRWAL